MLLSVRILVCLFLYTQQGQGDLSCQINQKQLMIVAVVNEKVKISCEYSCHLKPQPGKQTSSPANPVKFTVRLYKDYQNQTVKSLSRQAVEPHLNVAWEKRVKHTGDSGVYYCTDSYRTTSGTLLQVKHAVYVKTSFTLQYILGTICIILALYSVTATLVVLIKRKVCNRCKVCLMKPANPDTVLQAQLPESVQLFISFCQGIQSLRTNFKLSYSRLISPNSESQQNNRSHSTEDTTEDAYMALQIHKVSVYSSLHNDRSKMQASSQRNKASTSAQKVQSQAQEDVYECVYDSF
ncbi:uncharacterized protein LOC125487157 isoform X1 [Rhincodon typus]|uniref:uncharacterized protein LOC125487157 isoform X1 n=1 Tax=Rhincodon typus TaxID=259920 RepID=UPI00202E61F0|nr:uncharacterized protein LOC125487157 isoform X1 [Rhincodon typus]